MSIAIAPSRGPVCYWRHVQALFAGHGVPFRRSEHRGELTRMSVFIQGLGKTALVRPTLFLM